MGAKEAADVRNRIKVPQTNNREDYEEWLFLTQCVGALSEAVTYVPKSPHGQFYSELRGRIRDIEDYAWRRLYEADRRWRDKEQRLTNDAQIAFTNGD